MDGSGNVEWEEFENALTDFRVQLCFKNLGRGPWHPKKNGQSCSNLCTGKAIPAQYLPRIDIHKVSLEQIWQLIDFDNKGYIETLHKACLSLQTACCLARTQDLQAEDISEFADCLMEMHGVAHSIDIARLRRHRNSSVHHPHKTSFPAQQCALEL